MPGLRGLAAQHTASTCCRDTSCYTKQQRFTDDTSADCNDLQVSLCKLKPLPAQEHVAAVPGRAEHDTHLLLAAVQFSSAWSEVLGHSGSMLRSALLTGWSLYHFANASAACSTSWAVFMVFLCAAPACAKEVDTRLASHSGMLPSLMGSYT